LNADRVGGPLLLLKVMDDLGQQSHFAHVDQTSPVLVDILFYAK
jgi:hypothetical protein